MLSRRGLITGLVALVAAPAVIRTPGLLMPVRNIAVTGWVLDPVVMAASCVASIGDVVGTKPFERIDRDGRIHSSLTTVSREISYDEAERRVKAFVRDPKGYEWSRLAPVDGAGKGDSPIDRIHYPLGNIRPAVAFA